MIPLLSLPPIPRKNDDTVTTSVVSLPRNTTPDVAQDDPEKYYGGPSCPAIAALIVSNALSGIAAVTGTVLLYKTVFNSCKEAFKNSNSTKLALEITTECDTKASLLGVGTVLGSLMVGAAISIAVAYAVDQIREKLLKSTRPATQAYELMPTKV